MFDSEHHISRRGFLAGVGASAGIIALNVDTAIVVAAYGAVNRSIAHTALAAAKVAGASYADVRVQLRQDRSIATKERRVDEIEVSASLGFNVRVLAKGTWGFAASDLMTEQEAERVGKEAVAMAFASSPFKERAVELAPEPVHSGTWKTPVTTDPFAVPTDDIVSKLLQTNEHALAIDGIKYVSSSIHFLKETKLFVNSEGAEIEQEHHRLRPNLDVTAFGDNGDFRRRSANLQAMGAGYEWVEEIDWLGRVDYAAEEANAYLSATPASADTKDIILAPDNLWLTLHETVGHPTELDRAIGFEANFAGTSFCTVDKLGKLQYGATEVNLVADRTVDMGLATVGYDDEGVAAQEWHIVEDGRFVGYQTTREQAGWIGEDRSRGCSYTQGWDRVPFQRIPNIRLTPSKDSTTLDDIVSDTKDGILVTGRNSWSIDHQR